MPLERFAKLKRPLEIIVCTLYLLMEISLIFYISKERECMLCISVWHVLIKSWNVLSDKNFLGSDATNASASILIIFLIINHFYSYIYPFKLLFVKQRQERGNNILYGKYLRIYVWLPFGNGSSVCIRNHKDSCLHKQHVGILSILLYW